jgi:hypothetical protein
MEQFARYSYVDFSADAANSFWYRTEVVSNAVTPIDTSFAAQQSDEPADGVRLPARRLHDLRERRTLGALQHRDYFALLVAAIGFGFTARLLAAGHLLRGLGLLGAFARALSPPSDVGLLLVAESIVCSLISFSLPHSVCGRHIHHLDSEKRQVESAAIIRRSGWCAAGGQIGGLVPFFKLTRGLMTNSRADTPSKFTS